MTVVRISFSLLAYMYVITIIIHRGLNFHIKQKKLSLNKSTSLMRCFKVRYSIVLEVDVSDVNIEIHNRFYNPMYVVPVVD